MNLAERIRVVAGLDQHAPAIYFDGRTVTWGEVDAGIGALDAALSGAGVGPGDEVAVVLRNRPEHVVAVLALLATGRCLVTVNAAQGDERLASDLGALGPCPVAAAPVDWAWGGVDDAVSGAGRLGLVIVGPAGFVTRHTGSVPVPSRPAVAVRMLTSGTTGAPKRVDLTYEALERSITGAAHYESDGHEAPRLRRGVRLCWAPLGHISGLFAVVKNAVDGRPTALMERFDVEQWAGLIRQHTMPVAGLVPAALRMVLDAKVPKEELSSLRAVIAGSAPTHPDLIDQFVAVYGIPVLVVYGATEFAGAVAGWTIGDFGRWWAEKRGSVGRAHPGVSLRITDPATGTEFFSGVTGRLEVGQVPMSGGPVRWTGTSDLAHLDGDGFLFIDGRSDDAILRGGFKVFPDRVADALRRHPAIRDAGVVGIDDARLGAVPVAAVELRTGTEAITEDDLLAHLRPLLAPYGELPRRIRVVEALPRTTALKVSQPELRELLS